VGSIYSLISMSSLLGEFNAKVDREDILKPIIWNESLYEISTFNEVKIVNFTTSTNLTVKSTLFPHRNIQYLDVLKHYFSVPKIGA
jgi:hypothetical protein